MSGPTPYYQPDFPVTFVDHALDIIKRRTVSKQLWQRAMLVVLFDGDPEITNPQAAREVGLHENSVRKWRRHWAEGDFSLEDRPGRGAKPGFSPLQQKVVTAVACELVNQSGHPLSRQLTTDITR